jgi:Ca2+-binding RTX toxin-like protein
VLCGSSGNDVITGGSGNDRLSGVLSSGNSTTALGQNQVDVLTGGKGQDVFVLGDSRGVFYNDYNNANSGNNDYAQITDFNASDDKLQLLKGSYIATSSQGNLMLYWNRNNNNSLDLSGNNQDELIAKLQGITSLSSSNINWV